MASSTLKVVLIFFKKNSLFHIKYFGLLFISSSFYYLYQWLVKHMQRLNLVTVVEIFLVGINWS